MGAQLYLDGCNCNGERLVLLGTNLAVFEKETPEVPTEPRPLLESSGGSADPAREALVQILKDHAASTPSNDLLTQDRILTYARWGLGLPSDGSGDAVYLKSVERRRG